MSKPEWLEAEIESVAEMYSDFVEQQKSDVDLIVPVENAVQAPANVLLHFDKSLGLYYVPDQESLREAYKRSPDFDPGEDHIFGPYTNGTSIRLEAEEAYCEVEGESFHQFDEAEYDELDRRCCPYCGHQLQEYDKVFHSKEQDEHGLKIPSVCRVCEDNTRMEGNFRCPECHPDVEDGEEEQYDLVSNDDSSAPDVHKVQTEKAAWKQNVDYEKLDEILTEAHKTQVWPDDLTKAPTMWSSDDEVPDFVERWISDVIENVDPMWQGSFKDVPVTEENKVHETVKDSLTQSQGWSTASIANNLQQKFDWMTQDRAEIIARQEVAAVLNKAREVAYRARPDADQMVFDWVGPDDGDTTDICHDIKSRIAAKGGATTLDQLKDILKEVAEKYDYGTPKRVEQLLPHFQCRHTIMQRDLSDI